MFDLVKIENGKDLVILDSVIRKAANVVNVQQGSLEYAPDFGSDLKYFLESPFRFQDENLQGYFLQRLAQSQVDVSQLLVSEDLFRQILNFHVGDRAEGGLII